MREWQVIHVALDGGAQIKILAREEEAQRFFRDLTRKRPKQMKTGDERYERCTGFVIPYDRKHSRPILVKRLFVVVDDVSSVSVEDWDHSRGDAE